MKAYVEPNEVTLIERAAGNMRDALLIRLLFRLGCRISEALALAVGDVDFEHGTVTIKHLKASLKLSCTQCGQRIGKSHTFCPKCGGRITKSQAEQLERRRQRMLPLDHDTLDMLREYVKRGGPVVRDEKKVIFGINRHRAWQVVKECAERAGLPKVLNAETGRAHNVSPHKLRDAFAVMAMKQNDSGDSLRLLQEHLGHQSFNTTARYRKISGAEHQEWYQKLWSEKK
jgi:integrase/recombinase XerD